MVILLLALTPDTLPVINVLFTPPIIVLAFNTNASAPELFNVNVPKSVLILEEAADVTVPVIILSPDIFRIPPVVLEIPVLDKLIGSAANVIPPCISKAAPAAIVVLPLTLPNALALVTLMTPLLIAVTPV